jgi:hypothetical protein
LKFYTPMGCKNFGLDFRAPLKFGDFQFESQEGYSN